MTPEQPNDPPVQKIELSGGQASYTDVGEGPVLLMVHGLPGSHRDFRWLGACVPSSIRLIRVDMPGFGETEISCSSGDSISARADFVREFADALGLEGYAVGGHSMGGPVAMEVAAREPSRVTGLVLLASVGLREHRLYLRSRPKLAARLFRIPGAPFFLKGTLRKAYQKAGFPASIPDEVLIHTLQIVAAVDFPTIRKNQKQLSVPTMSCWAEDDRLVEHEICEELAKACPHGPRLVFPKGGHNIQKTHAVELGQALTDWLPSLSPDSL